MDTPYIEFKNITKRFDDVVALSDVSLSIPRGAFVTLLGPSGCGKTTLLRQLAGFSEPDAGEIYIGGKRVNGLPPYKRDTPLVFQDYALFPHMTISENIAYGLKLKKLPMRERKAKVTEMLEMFNLQGLEKRFPKQLSGGQQQRVAFARALVMGQDILLLDEPLSNLDAKLRVDVRVELRQIQQRRKITTIYVTHDQDEALSMSDLIAVMRNGRIEQVGTPWEIYFRPQTKFVADFVGVVNFLEATLSSASGRMAVIELCGRKLEIGLEKDWETGEKLTLVVRPESLVFLNSNDEEDRVVFVGEIINSSFLGRLTRYWVQAGNQTLIVDDTGSGPDQSRKGMVTLALDTGKTHVLTEDVR